MLPSKKTTFSIVLPTWNRCSLLKDALKSLQWQTWTDFEVIVVDNQSTDDTRSVVESLGDDRFTYVRPYTKLTQLECYSFGWNLASGNFAGSIDDDNVFLPSALQVLQQAIEHHPDIELFCFDRGLIYHVPDHPNESLQNQLRILGFEGGFERIADNQSRQVEFCQRIRFEQPYPGITNSFTRTRRLKQILNSYRPLFPGECIGGEEVVAMLLLQHTQSIGYIRYPLVVYGESGRNSTAELVSGAPTQTEFKHWYQGKLTEALSAAPVSLPLYPNFSLYGLRHAQKLLGLSIEPDWHEYYKRCIEAINTMASWWMVDPAPLLRQLTSSVKEHHPQLFEKLMTGVAVQSNRPYRVPPQIINGSQAGLTCLVDAALFTESQREKLSW